MRIFLIGDIDRYRGILKRYITSPLLLCQHFIRNLQIVSQVSFESRWLCSLLLPNCSTLIFRVKTLIEGPCSSMGWLTMRALLCNHDVVYLSLYSTLRKKVVCFYPFQWSIWQALCGHSIAVRWSCPDHRRRAATGVTHRRYHEVTHSRAAMDSAVVRSGPRWSGQTRGGPLVCVVPIRFAMVRDSR